MNKSKKRVLIISTTLCLVVALLAGTLSLAPNMFKKPTTYPYVFVHGLNGYGQDTEVLGEKAPYWGATSCNLLDELESRGYTCVAPSGGPVSSAWDRACELYAALTGTTVDYGEAHSKEFGHERFGQTYSSAMLPVWGKKDETGHIQKINIISHSFGGASARMFAELLANGSAQERAISGDSCSQLFEGGKADLIFSITALTAPHNGTTLLEAIDVGGFLGSVLNLLSIGLKTADELLDVLGIELSLDELLEYTSTKDNAYYDLTLRGAKELNNNVNTLSNVYYFSQPFDGTKDSGEYRVGNSDEMMLPLQATAFIMGRYTKNKYDDIPIDSSWLPNDGLVPTISQKSPSGALSEDFTAGEKLEKGVWYVYPTLRGDHGTPIGLSQTKDRTLSFYLEQMERIDQLSMDDSSNWLTLWLYGSVEK